MAQPTPWYLADPVLDILELIRGTTLKVVQREHRYVITREQWDAFDDVFASSLEAWHGHLHGGFRCMAHDVICAVTGQRLAGIHTRDDDDRLRAIADEVSDALATRSMAEAA